MMMTAFQHIPPYPINGKSGSPTTVCAPTSKAKGLNSATTFPLIQREDKIFCAVSGING